MKFRMQGDLMVVILGPDEAKKARGLLGKIEARPVDVSRPIVLAEGESRGHVHQIEGGVREAWHADTELGVLAEIGVPIRENMAGVKTDVFVVSSDENAAIVHRNIRTGKRTEEHGDLVLGPGDHIVIRQYEYSFREYQRVLD